MVKKSGLGKGLQALFNENFNIIDEGFSSKSKQNLFYVDVDKVVPNKSQPRKDFDEEGLSRLAESIKENGIIQPILVRNIKNGDYRYQIVAGERRFRAAKMVGLEKIPIVVKDIDELKITELALIENLQREDLNPIEEAQGYLILAEKCDLTHDEISKKVGKTRSTITNSLRLLKLPKSVVEQVKSRNLTEGQARALLALKDEKEIEKLAAKVVEKGLSVRDIEKIVNNKKKDKNEKAKKEDKINIFKDLEISMQQKLKRNVRIDVRSGEKGSITIEFYNRDELVAIGERLAKMKKFIN